MSAQIHILTARTSAPIRLARRRRIVAAALALAQEDGDVLHIRRVAHRAGVAPSTVYRHFSSKDDLLVACLHEWLLEIACRCPALPHDAVPGERVLAVIDTATRELCAYPLLADAATRAYLYADGGATDNAELCRNELSRILSAALDTAGHGDGVVGDLIADVWALRLPAVLQQRESIAGLLHRMRIALSAIGLPTASALVS